MKYINKIIAQNGESIQWNMTDDGFLRCTARIQQEGVLQYKQEEVDNLPRAFTEDSVVMLLSKEALIDPASLKSLEGMPVVAWDHTWTDPSVIKDVSIGSVSGTSRLENGFLVTDLLITDADTIALIKSGKLGEISAGYTANTIFEEGEFDGNLFDARQENLQYNHIAIIPVGTGRAGKDVRITNKQPNNGQEKEKMADNNKMVRVQSRHSKRFMNMDESSVAVYEEDSDVMNTKLEQSSEDLDKMRGVVDGYKTNMDDTGKLQIRIQELEGQLAAYKQQVEKLTNTDDQIEVAALNMMTETKEADNILENASLQNEDGSPMDEPTSKKYMNSILSLHGDALRKSVLNATGLKTDDMSTDALKGAWSVQNQILNMKPKVVAGSNMVQKNHKQLTDKVLRTSRSKLGLPDPK